ncbi:hypothetical protein HerbRD11066_20170 [Herbidospora sp. RD11066]
MRHAAERVVLFEDEHPLPAELRDRPRRRETAHPRPDHHDVGILDFTHAASLPERTSHGLNDL